MCDERLWRPGNLMTAGVARVLVRYRRARPLGMTLALFEDRARLAAHYGDHAGQRAYGSPGVLLSGYLGRYGAAVSDPANPCEGQR
jgi:hypothetical protein